MAIEFLENTTTAVLEVYVSGKLTSDDYSRFEPRVTEMVSECGKIRILFVMQDFHGWEAGALWEDIKFATKHCTDIERIAMIGDKTWQKWMATICKPFTMSAIKFFESAEESQARQWLKAESPVSG